jgi:hypothetical protein
MMVVRLMCRWLAFKLYHGLHAVQSTSSARRPRPPWARFQTYRCYAANRRAGPRIDTFDLRIAESAQPVIG